MNNIKSEKLILTVVIINSCLALSFNFISIVTNEWIVSNATNTEAVVDQTYPSTINYGLFSGYLKHYVIVSPLEYDLTVLDAKSSFNNLVSGGSEISHPILKSIEWYENSAYLFHQKIITCNYYEGKCMYSCQADSDKRQNELTLILTGKQPKQCDRKSAKSTFDFSLKSVNNLKQELKDKNLNKELDLTKIAKNLIGSGFWVCTVMFLIIDVLFSTASCILAIVNFFWNPIEPILNIFGLYIWNLISVGTGLLTMIIWGSLFEESLKYNIAITDTLAKENSYNSNGLASLGYSYFILFGAILLNGINISLLFLRSYLLSKVPPPVVINNNSDDTILTFY